MNSDSLKGNLYRLARLYDVQTAYYDIAHHRQQASPESLLAVLAALGAPVASFNDVPSALRHRRQVLAQMILEPVTVAWNGAQPVVELRFPASLAGASFTGHLDLETGEHYDWKWRTNELPCLRSEEIEGIRYVVTSLTLPVSLLPGYHTFRLEVEGQTCRTLIISAPQKTYSPPDGTVWGTFLPLYALQTGDSWGSGEYSGLAALADWTAGNGGNVLATLPLLPLFLDEPFEPSPYVPVSRLLWNEFYVDVTRVPELDSSTEVKKLLESPPFRKEIQDLRGSSLVDYRRVMALKRRALEGLCQCLSDSNSGRFGELKRFARANPLVEEYARFRAVMEKQGTAWPSWPQHLRDGGIKEGDYDEKNRLYHLYAQWLAHQQIEALSEKAAGNGVSLYLDLPLGVHPYGYDAWREPDLFTLNVTAGAPPDAVFTGGQNWWFPPLHPENIRQQGYRYVAAYIRHHLKHAGMLRIDHVMGLHRLFWIPRGMNAAHGVYVRYRAEELYAVLSLESHRHRSVIVGEDLGIVPSYVRPAMARHGLHRMYILHYELAVRPSDTMDPPPGNAVAGLNTHDMPPFASFWRDTDIPERLGFGLLDGKSALAERRTRRNVKGALTEYLRHKKFLAAAGAESVRDVLTACLKYLSASRARFVLVNLEDLWLETRPQNVPSTGDNYPSWRHKARYNFERFCRMPAVLGILKEVDSLRKKAANSSPSSKRSRP